MPEAIDHRRDPASGENNPASGEKMTTFDYGTAAEIFDYSTAAELFSNKGRKFRRQPLGYKRFARAEDAIRFAIEDMAPALLQSTYLEVNEVRFDSQGIRRLYESEAYPLARRAETSAQDDRKAS
jgi:hypothetical protein